MLNNSQFYQDLQPVSNFSEISITSKYKPLPNDWFVAVADIKGSTVAIQSGKYKEVNTLGVSVITAVLKALGDQNVPYVFGGDGATICLPNEAYEPVATALAACRRMARDAFDMELRIGIVPVSDISEGGHQVLVAKHLVSKVYAQAAFTGGGLEYADYCVKEESVQKKYLIPEGKKGDADFSGLECRWTEIPSPKGETVSLLIRALGRNDDETSRIYSNVLEHIDQIYGSVEESKPLDPQGLTLTQDGERLEVETKVRTEGAGGLTHFLYKLGIQIQVTLGKFLMATGLSAMGVQWGNYKSEVVENSDFRKFDDMLRQIISGSPDMRAKLTHFLEEEHKKGNLVYGIFVSDSALITCMIGEERANHIHFIDGSSGGYALAAKGLKEQLKSLNP